MPAVNSWLKAATAKNGLKGKLSVNFMNKEKYENEVNNL